MDGLPISLAAVEAVGSAAKVLSAIYQSANGGRDCVESYDNIARIAGVSWMTVYRDIHGPLREDGWIVFRGRQPIDATDARKMRTVTVSLSNRAIAAMSMCVTIPGNMVEQSVPFSEQVVMACIASSQSDWTPIPEIKRRSRLSKGGAYKAIRALQQKHLVSISEFMRPNSGDYYEMPCRHVAVASGA